MVKVVEVPGKIVIISNRSIFTSIEKTLVLLGMRLNVQIISEGCDDRGRHGSCGVAFIRINGRDYASKRRGYNIVVINSNTGTKQLISYENLLEFSCNLSTHGVSMLI